MSDPMTPLAERIEAAEGPDRELDLAITIAVKGGTEADWLTDELGRREFGRQWAYTASLDAAMSLVPEGWRVVRMSEDEADDTWKIGLGQRDGRFGAPGVEAFAATPALALCAAALRATLPARQSEEG